jgi:hypothetical protein
MSFRQANSLRRSCHSISRFLGIYPRARIDGPTASLPLRGLLIKIGIFSLIVYNCTSTARPELTRVRNMVPRLSQGRLCYSSGLLVARDDVLFALGSPGMRCPLHRRRPHVPAPPPTGFVPHVVETSTFQAVLVTCATCTGNTGVTGLVCLVYKRRCPDYREGKCDEDVTSPLS